MNVIKEYGCFDALEKYAIDWSSIGSGAKNFLIGQPKEFAKQFANGGLMKSKGLLRKELIPKPMSVNGKLDARNIASNAMQFGIPSYMLYSATKAPAENRGSAIGSTVGSNLGMMLGGPLGAVGQIGGALLGNSLGESVGSNFNKKIPG